MCHRGPGVAIVSSGIVGVGGISERGEFLEPADRQWPENH